METAVAMEKVGASIKKVGASIKKALPGQKMAYVGKALGKKIWCADGTCRNIDLQDFASDIERRFVNNTELVNKMSKFDDKYVSKDQLRAFANANNLKLM